MLSTAILLSTTAARVVVGSFFAIAGFHKLTRQRSWDAMRRMMDSCHIPHPEVMTPVISTIELLAGLGVAWGFLTPLSAMGLIGVSLVATCTNGRKSVAQHWRTDNDIGDEFNAYAYMPECLYVLLLLPFLFGAAESLSLDRLIMAII